MSDFARANQGATQPKLPISVVTGDMHDFVQTEAKGESPIKIAASKRRGRSSIALIDARPVLREGLTHWLRSIRRGSHVSCFSMVAELIESVSALDMDMIVLSSCSSAMAGSQVLAAVDELIGNLPGKPVVVLSDHGEEIAVAALRHGAHGYISTTIDPLVARAALDLVMVGGRFIPATMLIDSVCSWEKSEHPVEPSWERLTTRFDPVPADPEPAEGRTVFTGIAGDAASLLTSREAEVFGRIQQGKSNKVIAYELGMCESTVKVHVRNLMTKLKAINRTQLAVLPPMSAARRTMPTSDGN